MRSAWDLEVTDERSHRSACVAGLGTSLMEAVVACVECVLVVGRQRSQGGNPPGRVCLKREDHTLAQNRRDREELRRRYRWSISSITIARAVATRPLTPRPISFLSVRSGRLWVG